MTKEIFGSIVYRFQEIMQNPMNLHDIACVRQIFHFLFYQESNKLIVLSLKMDMMRMTIPLNWHGSNFLVDML